GTLVRNHYLKEPPVDLKELLRSETGRDIDIDQDEIMDNLLGRRFWPSTFDLPMLRETLAIYRDKATSAGQAYDGPSPPERAIAALLQRAQTWLSTEPEIGTKK